MLKIALGKWQELCRFECVKAVLAEVILTFLFVFAGVGSSMAMDKLEVEGTSIVQLAFVALTHAFVVYAMVSAGFNISGGHLNPAVTLGLAVGGHITVMKSFAYWIAQCLGSAIACYLLVFITGGLVTPVHALGTGVTYIEGVIWEIVLTFSLLFTVYATAVDPKKGSIGPNAPLCIGLVVGANIMAGGTFSGASMNPARSSGPALASGDWTGLWVYWVGPLIGGALAGTVYETIFLYESYQRVPDVEE